MVPAVVKDTMMRILRVMSLCLAALWLAACASTPEPIRAAPPGAPQPDEVRADPARFQGSQVRWGGVIAGVNNLADHTLVEVVSRPLTSGGRPRESDVTQGRFLARVPGFLDPAVYVAGREITVSGRVAGLESRPVGDYPYPYVRVDVDVHQLWAVREPVRDPYYSPWWYDPWYPYHPIYGPWRRY
ncbi:outer membrane lipoprotein, Slp family [Thioalkalivibrio sulfidiphilus HL-EbGr7]|uniref:Outer membrane lipoprotein, Slp family n=2 Tax=Thioalkalivibrio TaxID=106633 RepID=B8GMC8_THISH|nr:outer membrane lipoprotein, Slp family [Thioalkalivibrio sulfidiphilus HL-EbGr7]